MKRSKSRVNEGESLKYRGTFFIVQEVFKADGLNWVRCTYTRKKYQVRYEGKTHIVYDTENRYMTELEWITISRT